MKISALVLSTILLYANSAKCDSRLENLYAYLAQNNGARTESASVDGMSAICQLWSVQRNPKTIVLDCGGPLVLNPEMFNTERPWTLPANATLSRESLWIRENVTQIAMLIKDHVSKTSLLPNNQIELEYIYKAENIEGESKTTLILDATTSAPISLKFEDFIPSLDKKTGEAIPGKLEKLQTIEASFRRK